MTTLLEPLPPPLLVAPERPRALPVQLPELPPAIDFGGLAVRPLTRTELIETLVGRARLGMRTRVHYLNAHVFNLARRDAGFRHLLANCDLLYADGISVVWASRLLGYSIPGRLTAADYFVDFGRVCAARSLSLFLIGGAAGVAEIASARLRQLVPGLRVAGTSQGYLSDRASKDLVQRMNDSGADVLVAGMSSPRQERWIAEYGSGVSIPVQWAVGALLDYFAGTERRAPAWVCRWHSEWLYRLMLKPRSRWRRYLIGNAEFGLWLAGQLLLPQRAGVIGRRA